MIYSLTGKVNLENENTIIVDTGNMAFEVICSSYTAFALSGKSEPQTVLTYLQVREDAMCLYGFKTKAVTPSNKPSGIAKMKSNAILKLKGLI